MGESRITILYALAANIVLAIAKLVAGLLTGSAALLAEAAHSIADTIDQLALLWPAVRLLSSRLLLSASR